jgi:hypothetical protein
MKFLVIILMVLFMLGCQLSSRCVQVAYRNTNIGGVNKEVYWFKGYAWQDQRNPRFEGYVLAEEFVMVTKRGEHKYPMDLCAGFDKMPRGFYHVIFTGGYVMEGEVFLKDGTVWVYPSSLPAKALEGMAKSKLPDYRERLK